MALSPLQVPWKEFCLFCWIKQRRERVTLASLGAACVPGLVPPSSLGLLLVVHFALNLGKIRSSFSFLYSSQWVGRNACVCVVVFCSGLFENLKLGWESDLCESEHCSMSCDTEEF